MTQPLSEKAMEMWPDIEWRDHPLGRFRAYIGELKVGGVTFSKEELFVGYLEGADNVGKFRTFDEAKNAVEAAIRTALAPALARWKPQEKR